MDTDVARYGTADAVDLRSVARGPSGTPISLSGNNSTRLVDLEPRVGRRDALGETLDPAKVCDPTPSEKGGL
jgi:hypothetical protein